MKNLVMLWGWSNTEKTYQRFINTAPSGWKIHQIPYPKLLPDGNIRSINGNLLDFLDRNNLDKIYLLGHSLGGALALEFAGNNPERVKKLYLLDTSGIYDGKPIFQALKSVISHTHTNKVNIISTYVDLFHNFKNPILQIKLGKLAHFIDLQRQAKNLKIPTEIFWGQEDRVNPLWQGQKLHKLIKGSKLTTFKGVGHDWIIHSPELFWQQVK